MLNVNKLENRWRIYKLKSYLPHGVILLSSITILILVYAIYSSDTNKDEIAKIKPKKVIKEHKLEKITLKQKEPEIMKVIKPVSPEEKTIKEPIAKDKIVLSPSLNFMSNMRHNAVPYYESNKAAIISTQKVKTQNPQLKEPEVVKESPKKLETVEVEEIKTEILQEKSIHIERRDTQEDINHVIKRFKKNNNPALSLFVAKKFYELGDYHKSYNYALMTNELNDNIDASWIIFTKSLVKLNEKDEAIKVLTKYIEHSNSNQAKILLEDISSGKFE